MAILSVIATRLTCLRIKQTRKQKKRQKITKSEAGAMAQAGESWEELYRRLSKDYIIV